MAEPSRVLQGYLVIADISGYTAYLTGSELEEANGVIADLTQLIVHQLVPPMTLAKLEGDAVFCYARSDAFSDGEELLELLEACYYRFREHQENMVRSTTCSCAACQTIKTLDLKFVAHHGTFVCHELAGSEEIAGPDVILVHRLLKNSITERCGAEAYAFMTAASMARFEHEQHLAAHSESYDALGEVSGGVYDLKPSLEARREANRDVVTAGESDVEIVAELSAAPRLVWPHFIDPRKRLAWQRDLTGFANTPNGQGRLGAGAESHCGHGSWASVIRYTDWRPFDYVTAEQYPTRSSFAAAPPMRVTLEFQPIAEDRTLFRMRCRMIERGPRMALKLMLMRPIVRRSFGASLRKLEAMLREEQEAALSADPARAGAPEVMPTAPPA